MKKENQTYSILWFNNNLRIDDDNPTCKLLSDIRDTAEQTYPISIQACVSVDDFVEFTRAYKWHVLLMDHKDDDDRVISKVMKKIKGENQDALRYCLSLDIPEANEDDLLEMYDFSKNPNTGKRFFQIKDTVEQSIEVFGNIVKELDDESPLFNGFSELKEVYKEMRTFKQKKSIKELLKWHKIQKSHDNLAEIPYYNFEDGIRDVVDEITGTGGSLERIGFYNNSGRSFGSYIDGSPEGKKKNFLNETCRFKWESVPMAFLARFSNSVKHDDTFAMPFPGEENYPYYDQHVRCMVFEAFVVFCRWYVRFMQKYHENNDDITMFFNDIKSVSEESTAANQEQSSTNKVYEGIIELHFNGKDWGVKLNYKGKQIFALLDEYESKDWNGGECVFLSLKEYDPIKKPNHFVAINVRIKPVNN